MTGLCSTYFHNDCISLPLNINVEARFWQQESVIHLVPELAHISILYKTQLQGNIDGNRVHDCMYVHSIAYLNTQLIAQS